MLKWIEESGGGGDRGERPGGEEGGPEGKGVWVLGMGEEVREKGQIWLKFRRQGKIVAHSGSCRDPSLLRSRLRREGNGIELIQLQASMIDLTMWYDSDVCRVEGIEFL